MASSSPNGDSELASALEIVASFLAAKPLTRGIAELEHALEDCDIDGLEGVLEEHGVSPELLSAAIVIRSRLGRINDLIHASAITLALPHLLEPGETLRRPSLAAGNDSSRPFDVETDRRIAEFKLGRWHGADAMRKRQLVKDLVVLAADTSGKKAELYVVGERPLRFLKETRSKMSWALDRAPGARALFETRFGSLEVAVPAFAQSDGARVEIIDLEQRLPALFG
jgi:hypothetical protein